jgi:membrane protein DedA with SNARE-associated domain
VLFVAEALAWAGVPAIGAGGMAAAGALASQGTVHLWSVIVVGTLGAWLGGLCGWWIGRRVARAGLDHDRGHFAERRTKALGAGEKLAQRWGPLMVFFVPSWVSGGLGMQLRPFAAWNLAATLVWVIVAGLGAYGVTSAASGGSLSNSVLPLLVAVLAAAALVAAFVHVRRRRGAPRSPASEERSSAIPPP